MNNNRPELMERVGQCLQMPFRPCRYVSRNNPTARMYFGPYRSTPTRLIGLATKGAFFNSEGSVSREYPLITTNGTPRSCKAFATSTELPSRRRTSSRAPSGGSLPNQAHREISSINRTNYGKSVVCYGVRKTLCSHIVVFDDQNSLTIQIKPPTFEDGQCARRLTCASGSQGGG